jgi:hypothetical protein
MKDLYDSDFCIFFSVSAVSAVVIPSYLYGTLEVRQSKSTSQPSVTRR